MVLAYDQLTEEQKSHIGIPEGVVLDDDDDNVPLTNIAYHAPCRRCKTTVPTNGKRV
jgi:hypothetical protein